MHFQIEPKTDRGVQIIDTFNNHELPQDDEPKVNYMVIGNHMRDIRKRKGFTQEDVAALMKVSRNFYSSLERGKKQISLLRLLQFSSITQTTINDVIAGAYPRLADESTAISTNRENVISILDQCSEEMLATIYGVCRVLAESQQK